MAIQRQAQEPGNALLHGESVKYSLAKSDRTVPKAPAQTRREKSISPAKDVLWTLLLFGLAVGAILTLYFKWK